jgi:hypothetical protein
MLPVVYCLATHTGWKKLWNTELRNESTTWGTAFLQVGGLSLFVFLVFLYHGYVISHRPWHRNQDVKSRGLPWIQVEQRR